MIAEPITQRRQIVYWRLLSALFGYTEQAENFEQMVKEITHEVGLPELILDPYIGIDTLLHHYPELESEFSLEVSDSEFETATLRRGLIFSKLLLNTFGPNTQSKQCTAQQYVQWLKDVEHLERAMGCPRGSLRGNAPAVSSESDGTGNPSDRQPSTSLTRPAGKGVGGGPGMGFEIPLEEIQRALKGLETDLIKRMSLREVLHDDRLAAQLQPSMELVEHLLRDKSNLSGNALKNAKRLIHQFIDELAEVLLLQVKQVPSGKIDRSVPPKRVFRNLDLKRTVWKNLINWNEEENRLYVDRLFFKQTGRKKLPTQLIVVVDQSGSMVNSMVPCAILASIFAGLPHVDVHLVAYDTQVIDLTDYVHDPFEVLMRTKLGGGNDTCLALDLATSKIRDPRLTALVLISDFYEGANDQKLFNYIKAIKDTGVHFIPVGSVDSSGYVSVNRWFTTRLKELGTPIMTGNPKKLIAELKKLIVV